MSEALKAQVQAHIRAHYPPERHAGLFLALEEHFSKKGGEQEVRV